MGRFPHCPRCGGATRPVQAEGRERDRCDACARLWYENAKPCAGAVVVDGDRLLLVKRAIEPYKGCWDLPGGFLEADEHPADGARREVLEETGLEVEVGALIGMYVDSYRGGPEPVDWHHSLNVFYVARPVGGAISPNAESSEIRWFRRAELPPIDTIAYENGRRALRDFLKLEQG
jgi:ADP-ribose pyrophosphatase YjhB (NUDIX family)